MWPFVGRQRELDRLLAAVRGRRTRGLAITGPPGVGKSRLTYEALATLDPGRFVVHTLVATPANSGVAFGALGVLIPDEAAPSPSRNVLVRTAASAVAGRSDARRTVIMVDDAHLLDDASAALLCHLARTSAAFVLVVLRSGIPVPDTLAALWTEGLIDQVELTALRPAKIGHLLSTVLGGQVAELTVRRLSELTAGNPLLLRELVLAGLQTGNLRVAKDVWRWIGPWLVAPRLAELVDRRIGELDSVQRWALELLALAEPVGHAVLARLVSDEVLVQLEARGLLWVQQDGRRSMLRLAHPLYGEALRERCPPLRTRKAKLLLADAVAVTGAHRRTDALQVATWRLDAGGRPDTEMLLAAARRAWTLLDLALAERLAREAVATTLSTKDNRRLIDTSQVLWRVLISGERHAELMSLLDSMAAMASTGGQRTKIAFGRAETLFWGLGDAAAAQRALPSQRAVAAGEAGQGEELAVLRTAFLAFSGNLRPARVTIPALLAEGMSNKDAEAKARVLHEIAVAYGEVGPITEPPPQQRPELAEAAASMPWITPTWALARVQAALLRGRVAEAAEHATRDHDAALGPGWEYALVVSSIACAQVARFAGANTEARRWLREAVALHEAGTTIGRTVQRLLYGELAHVEALAGDSDAAQQALDAADDIDWAPARLFGLWAELARPWVAAARGANDLAVQFALATADLAGTMAATAVEILALHDAVRLGAGRLAADRLGKLIDSENSAAALPYVRYADAITQLDATDLSTYTARRDTAVRRLDAAARRLDAAARQLAVFGLHALAAEAYGRSAEGFQAAGLHRSAQRARALAIEHLRRCTGQTLPRAQPGSLRESGRWPRSCWPD